MAPRRINGSNYVSDMGGFITEGVVEFNFCSIAKTAELSNSNLDDETAATSIILDMILQEGFEISSMQMFTLDKPTAEEFFEVYMGVLPEFTSMIEQVTLGPCIVLEVR